VAQRYVAAAKRLVDRDAARHRHRHAGLGAARSALLGSVSSGLIQNVELPILVVPDEPAASTADQDS
jgi:hypothetical protein